jgi:tripartite ATP-independent transporter DctM subunit
MDYLPLTMFPALFALVLLGFPIAFSLIGVALVFGYFTYQDIYVYQLIGRVESISSNFILAAVPLFIFMGSVLERSGIAERLFDAFRMWTRHLPGGLAVAAILMCVMFAASSGVVGATETVVGLLAIPTMLKYAYSKRLISGTICAGGSLGTIIPPSVVLIVLGPMAEVSIGRLFAGAMLPGLILAGLYIAYIMLSCLIWPETGPRAGDADKDMSFKEQLVFSARVLVPPLLLVTCVLGSILAGIASPTEAAGIGGAGALLLSVIYGTVTWKNLTQAVMKTLSVTAMIMFILMGGMMFTSVFFSMGGMRIVSSFVLNLELSPLVLLALILFLAFLLGCFLEWISILMIFIPIFTPIIVAVGFDPVWFCILFLVIIQTSYLTPPMAPAIFYLRGIAPRSITIRDMYVGMLPFLIIQMLVLILLMAFPQMILWLPTRIFG